MSTDTNEALDAHIRSLVAGWTPAHAVAEALRTMADLLDAGAIVPYSCVDHWPRKGRQDTRGRFTLDYDTAPEPEKERGE